ncbi:MAG: hypothetical protein FJ253_02745 [Phycisphaerae bacterium]|nr:hypothetical protein [Phycisphaerae bacterium]
MEFVSYAEAWPALRQQGLEEAERTDAELHLALRETEQVAVIDVATTDHRSAAKLPPEVRRVPRQSIPLIVEAIVHRLRLDPVVLIPVGRWREVFDAVAFGMAENEVWKAVDQMASVELNTRDPILLGPGDHHTLRELLRVLLADGTKDSQGLSIAASGTSILIELLPCGQMILFMGNPAMAVQVGDVIDQAGRSDSTAAPDSAKQAPQRRHS